MSGTPVQNSVFHVTVLCLVLLTLHRTILVNAGGKKENIIILGGGSGGGGGGGGGGGDGSGSGAGSGSGMPLILISKFQIL